MRQEAYLQGWKDAIGAVMRSAGTQGLIVATDTYVRSTRPTCHAAVVRVWVAS